MLLQLQVANIELSKIPTAEAAVMTAEDYKMYAYHMADMYQIDPGPFVKTLECESGWDPLVRGDHGKSVGIAQIYGPAHKDITLSQREDGIFSINWAAKEFSKGNQKLWSCWKNNNGYRGSGP